jgi:hypothetical protein
MKFRVEVWETITVNGWVTIEADSEAQARALVVEMEWDDIRQDAEWGSCGDTAEIEVGHYIEEVYEPTVSEILWT